MDKVVKILLNWKILLLLILLVAAVTVAITRAKTLALTS